MTIYPSYCFGTDCPLRHNCWRYIEGLGVVGYATWMKPLYDGKYCPAYMGN